MKPAGVLRDHDAIFRAALANCREFDKPRFFAWLAWQKSEEIRRAARLCPPWQLYRVHAENDSAVASITQPVLYGAVIGYAEGQCAVWILGVLAGKGASDDPILAPTTVLRDATQELELRYRT